MKELEDYSWFPPIFRQYQMDYIGFMVNTFGVYKPLVNYITLHKNTPTLYDLCSGAGKPSIAIFKANKCFNNLILSDKFPQNIPYESNVLYNLNSVDVLHLKFEPQYTYTMLNAFHHFNALEKKQIVDNMLQANANAYIAEILQPNILTFFKILLATTLGTLLFTPFIKPFSLKRIFFTYIVPINIITIAFDGLVSVLKSNTKAQFDTMFKDKNVNTIILKNPMTTLVVLHIKANNA